MENPDLHEGTATSDLERIQKSNLPEMAGGVVLILIGLYAAWQGLDYSIGTLRKLGSGGLPVVLGIVLVGFGLVIVLQSARFERKEFRLPLRVMLAIMGALMAWALLVPHVGFIIGTFLLVFISSLAQKPFRIWTPLAISVALSALGSIVFIEGLKIPLPHTFW